MRRYCFLLQTPFEQQKIMLRSSSQARSCVFSLCVFKLCWLITTMAEETMADGSSAASGTIGCFFASLASTCCHHQRQPTETLSLHNPPVQCNVAAGRDRSIKVHILNIHSCVKLGDEYIESTFKVPLNSRWKHISQEYMIKFQSIKTMTMILSCIQVHQR